MNSPMSRKWRYTEAKRTYGHLVEALQLLHDERAHLLGAHLLLGPLLNGGLHAIGHAFNGGHAHRALLALP
jgi:hypothetical protein